MSIFYYNDPSYDLNKLIFIYFVFYFYFYLKIVIHYETKLIHLCISDSILTRMYYLYWSIYLWKSLFTSSNRLRSIDTLLNCRNSFNRFHRKKNSRSYYELFSLVTIKINYVMGAVYNIKIECVRRDTDVILAVNKLTF